MKIFLLATKFINTLRKTDRIAFYFIFIGMVISSSIFLVFNSFYWEGLYVDNTNSSYSNRIDFIFNIEDNANKALMYLFNETDIVNNVYIEEDINIDNIQETFIVATYIPEFTNVKKEIIWGRYFSDDEINNRESVFVYGSGFLDKLNIYSDSSIINKKTEINGIQFSAIGKIKSYKFDILLSYDTFIKTGLESKKIGYEYDKNTDIRKIEELNSEIIDRYLPISIIRPENLNNNIAPYVEKMKQIWMVMLFAVFNYFFIYKFIQLKRLYSYSVCKLCGITTTKLFITLLIEITILIVASFVISMVFQICSFPLSQNVREPNFIIEFLYAFVMIFLLNIVVSIPSIINIVKKSPIQLEKESQVI